MWAWALCLLFCNKCIILSYLIIELRTTRNAGTTTLLTDLQRRGITRDDNQCDKAREDLVKLPITMPSANFTLGYYTDRTHLVLPTGGCCLPRWCKGAWKCPSRMIQDLFVCTSFSYLNMTSCAILAKPRFLVLIATMIQTSIAARRSHFIAVTPE